MALPLPMAYFYLQVYDRGGVIGGLRLEGVFSKRAYAFLKGRRQLTDGGFPWATVVIYFLAASTLVCSLKTS
ncbi:hypothetical protein EVAR_99721_1 [Eumeta japonica]|uniref:Uncharacterized protein n=1 Tax=Eumeta variegata TaxID=151549 RepID=A0A4C1ZK69_EUMVA|nr:hypothetical protein EVAR_99721_1 [Eumeta japonica]